MSKYLFQVLKEIALELEQSNPMLSFIAVDFALGLNPTGKQLKVIRDRVLNKCPPDFSDIYEREGFVSAFVRQNTFRHTAHTLSILRAMILRKGNHELVDAYNTALLHSDTKRSYQLVSNHKDSQDLVVILVDRLKKERQGSFPAFILGLIERCLESTSKVLIVITGAPNSKFTVSIDDIKSALFHTNKNIDFNQIAFEKLYKNKTDSLGSRLVRYASLIEKLNPVKICYLSGPCTPDMRFISLSSNFQVHLYQTNSNDRIKRYLYDHAWVNHPSLVEKYRLLENVYYKPIISCPSPKLEVSKIKNRMITVLSGNRISRALKSRPRSLESIANLIINNNLTWYIVGETSIDSLLGISRSFDIAANENKVIVIPYSTELEKEIAISSIYLVAPHAGGGAYSARIAIEQSVPVFSIDELSDASRWLESDFLSSDIHQLCLDMEDAICTSGLDGRTTRQLSYLRKIREQ